MPQPPAAPLPECVAPASDPAPASRAFRVLHRRVTQKDIAAIAGVHNTTVSLALRDDPSISPGTRQRIAEVAHQLGYRPDPALSALVSYRRSLAPNRRRKTIAYATGGTSRWAWQDDAKEAKRFGGAQQAAKQRGLQLEHFWLDEPQMSPKRLAEILYNRGITGMILSAASPRLHPFIDFATGRLHVVSLGSHGIRPPGTGVTCDVIGDIRQAVRRTFGAGYRRPALVIGDPAPGSRDHALWLGFLTEKNTAPHPAPFSIFSAHSCGVSSTSEAAPGRRTRFRMWLENTQPDVLIGSSGLVHDLLAVSPFRIPHDLALVDPCLQYDPTDVAGMRQHPEYLGQVAIEMIAPRLASDPRSISSAQTTTLIEGSWHRGTTLPDRAAPTAPSTVGGARSRNL